MKKFLLLFFAALCIIFASCSKDSGLGPGSDPFVAMSKGYPAHVPVIVVPPDKDGEDDGDTDDLLAAFAQAEGNPGTIIKLSEGEYHVGYMEILGFHGTLMGAGRNKTIIFVDGLIDQYQQYYDYNYMPCWLRILGGDVVISDLAIKTGDGSLVKEPLAFPEYDIDYKSTLISLVVVNNYSELYGNDDPQSMDFTIKNVDFLCGTMDPASSYFGAGYNVLMALWVGFPHWDPLEEYVLTKGNYNVRNCYFETTYQGFEALGLGEEAVCNVTQTKINDVLFGMFFTGNFGSKINLTDNTFVNSRWFDVLIDDNEWGIVAGDINYNRSEYLVSGNKFHSCPGSSSLVFQDTRHLLFPDYYYDPTLAIIKNNYFSLKEGCTGISLYTNIDGQIRNNRLAGTAETGIHVDGLTWGFSENPPKVYAGSVSENALILGNNLTGLNSTAADIWLGSESMNCTVVGSGKESVIDEGTNNKVTGMNRKPGGGHIGPTIRDNFQMSRGRRN